MLSKRLTWIWPCILTLVVSGGYIGVRLAQNEFDALALAEVGPRFSELDPEGEPGYDGQFSYYMARDLSPHVVESYLDVPAYRYQRILYPLLARTLAFGREAFIPWALLGINWIAHGAATLGVCWILNRKDLPVRYALIYGLWVGLISAVGLDLHEALAFGLVIAAWLMKERRQYMFFSLFLVMALFTKETTLLFWVSALGQAWMMRSENKSIYWLVGGGFIYGLWQLWLWRVFGSFGIGSGGDMASGFELIPFMGLIRIGIVDWQVFGLFLVIFGPAIVLPTLWGLYLSIKAKDQTLSDWPLSSLLTHALLIVFLPFSTFREPLGLVRIATGLLLSLLIVLSDRKDKKPLNIGLFWIAMLVLLIPQ